jgi:branched-chain amino acid aminotransferase
MSTVQLFAATPAGPQPLAIPTGATSVHDLFDGCDLALGAYTTFCTFEHNKFLRLSDHLDRLEASIALLGNDCQLDRPTLRLALHQVCTAFPGPEARVRLDLLAEPALSLGSNSRLLIALAPFTPLPEDLYRMGVRVGLVSRLRRVTPLAKEAAFIAERRPFLERDDQAYEQLLLDDHGYVLEGATSNFYAVHEGVLRTAGQGVLEGIARKIVLEQAVRQGIPVSFSPIHQDEIGKIDEAALSSASRALVPIVNIAGQVVGSGRPGPVTEKLLQAYRTYVAQEIRPAVDDPAVSITQSVAQG